MRTQRGVSRRGVWRLVCLLVVLAAMDYGRQLAARRILEGRRSTQPGTELAARPASSACSSGAL